jgi:nucleoside-diphosphate-sugar epimerase
VSGLLVLGAGYIGAALAAHALDAGEEVVLADNWYATDRAQLDGLAARGARVVDADIRDPAAVAALLADGPDVVHLLAAQASRPISERDPDYTEETNVLGVRRVAQAVAALPAPRPAVVFASSLHVYGPGLRGAVGPDAPYGEQGDLAHLSKVYGELCLRLHARRAPFDLALARIGITYGPGPVTHERPESQTVVDRFRRLAAAGEELTLDDGGRATIGAVHVEDAARILHGLPSEPGITAVNVAGDTITVAGVAALARGEEPAGEPACRFTSPFDYRHSVASYLRA